MKRNRLYLVAGYETPDKKGFIPDTELEAKLREYHNKVLFPENNLADNMDTLKRLFMNLLTGPSDFGALANFLEKLFDALDNEGKQALTLLLSMYYSVDGNFFMSHEKGNIIFRIEYEERKQFNE